MSHWKNPLHAIFCPIMLWAFLATAAPITLSMLLQQFFSFDETAFVVMRTVIVFCILVFTPLAVFGDIAPPFVTRIEVNWRNRHSELFSAPMEWEDVPFLEPVLNRVRISTGERQSEKEKNVSIATQPGTAS